MGITTMSSSERRPETESIAELEATEGVGTIPLRTFGPYRSEYGRLCEFPNCPPLLVSRISLCRDRGDISWFLLQCWCCQAPTALAVQPMDQRQLPWLIPLRGNGPDEKVPTLLSSTDRAPPA